MRFLTILRRAGYVVAGVVLGLFLLVQGQQRLLPYGDAIAGGLVVVLVGFVLFAHMVVG